MTGIATILSVGAGTGAGEFVAQTTGQPEWGLLLNALVSLATVVVTNYIKSKQDEKRVESNIQKIKDYNKQRAIEKRKKKKYGYVRAKK